jgi:hypothetical protein
MVVDAVIGVPSTRTVMPASGSRIVGRTLPAGAASLPIRRLAS